MPSYLREWDAFVAAVRDGRDAAGHRRRRARAAGHRPGRLALAARAAPRSLDEVDGGIVMGVTTRSRPSA